MLISDEANGSTCHQRRMLLDRGFGGVDAGTEVLSQRIRIEKN
jgi:hypothetical protein